MNNNIYRYVYRFTLFVFYILLFINILLCLDATIRVLSFDQSNHFAPFDTFYIGTIRTNSTAAIFLSWMWFIPLATSLLFLHFMWRAQRKLLACYGSWAILIIGICSALSITPGPYIFKVELEDPYRYITVASPYSNLSGVFDKHELPYLDIFSTNFSLVGDDDEMNEPCVDRYIRFRWPVYIETSWVWWHSYREEEDRSDPYHDSSHYRQEEKSPQMIERRRQQCRAVTASFK